MKNLMKNFKLTLMTIGLLTTAYAQSMGPRSLIPAVAAKTGFMAQAKAAGSRISASPTGVAATDLAAVVMVSGCLPAAAAQAATVLPQIATTVAAQVATVLPQIATTLPQIAAVLPTIDPSFAAGLMVGRGIMGLSGYAWNRAMLVKPVDTGLVASTGLKMNDSLTDKAIAMVCPEIEVNKLYNRLDLAGQKSFDIKRLVHGYGRVGATVAATTAMSARYGAEFALGVDYGLMGCMAHLIYKMVQRDAQDAKNYFETKPKP